MSGSLGWAGKIFAGRGWRHEIWSGASSVVLANVRFLAAYRYRDRLDARVVADVDDAVAEPVSIGGLESVWPHRTGEVRAVALHLVWQGVFRVDLSVPLSSATVLERAA